VPKNYKNDYLYGDSEEDDELYKKPKNDKNQRLKEEPDEKDEVKKKRYN
jgi:hypothetical protein